MADRPKFFDDLAGMAGGALSALTGMREEMEAMVRARIDEAMRRLDVVRREDLDAVAEMAANARAGQEAAETRLAPLAVRLEALEARLQALEVRLEPSSQPVSQPPSGASFGGVEGGGG